MSSLPIAHWQAALDQMGAALAVATRTLDRAEERWDRAFAPSAGEGELPPALDRIEARLREWDARLSAADELTGSVETELAERVASVESWRALFARWEELLQHKSPPQRQG
jgi:phage shock protein A